MNATIQNDAEATGEPASTGLERIYIDLNHQEDTTAS